MTEPTSLDLDRIHAQYLGHNVGRRSGKSTAAAVDCLGKVDISPKDALIIWPVASEQEIAGQMHNLLTVCVARDYRYARKDRHRALVNSACVLFVSPANPILQTLGPVDAIVTTFEEERLPETFYLALMEIAAENDVYWPWPKAKFPTHPSREEFYVYSHD